MQLEHIVKVRKSYIMRWKIGYQAFTDFLQLPVQCSLFIVLCFCGIFIFVKHKRFSPFSQLLIDFQPLLF